MYRRQQKYPEKERIIDVAFFGGKPHCKRPGKQLPGFTLQKRVELSSQFKKYSVMGAANAAHHHRIRGHPRAGEQFPIRQLAGAIYFSA
ncbi:MAG: hypothetical protein LBT01_02115 [Spirochaetaceae bacterium]|jgi:hypothetical protein|nr:hypothetical protein [Spirochaetaceae bacterium]